MRLILWIVTLLTVAAYISGPVADPDLWWHIVAGRWIIHERAVPEVDYWSLFGAGHPWRAYSWAPEILFAAAESAWGTTGLYALKLATAALLALTLGYTYSKISRDWFFGAMLGLLGVAACFNHFTLRPQSLVWIYFTLLIGVADRIDERGPRGSLLAGVAIVMCLWANTHLTAILGLAVAAGWVFNPAKIAPAALVLLAGIAGTLVTPYLGGEWLTFFEKTGHPFSHRLIIEFKPATIMDHSTGFLVISLALLAAVAVRRMGAIPVTRLLLLGAFVLASLAVLKFIPFAVIFALALAARAWRDGGDALGNLGEAVERLRVTVRKIPHEGLCFVLLCVIAVNVYNTWHNPIAKSVVPVDAVDFMERAELPHPVLNDFGRGGYLMYRWSDAHGRVSHRPVIDGRTNVVPPEVWEKFEAAYLGRESWREYLELIDARTVIWANESPFNSLLITTGDWCRVYRSGDQSRGYSIFVRRELFDERREASGTLRLISDTCESPA